MRINISPLTISKVYLTQHGSSSEKTLGAGGFLVFYVRPEKQDAAMDIMKNLLYVPFCFEDNGTKVIHYTPKGYTPRKKD